MIVIEIKCVIKIYSYNSESRHSLPFRRLFLIWSAEIINLLIIIGPAVDQNWLHEPAQCAPRWPAVPSLRPFPPSLSFRSRRSVRYARFTRPVVLLVPNGVMVTRLGFRLPSYQLRC